MATAGFLSAEVLGLCGLAFGWAVVSSVGGLQTLMYQQLVCRDVLSLSRAACDSERVPAAVTEETADRLATFVFCTQITVFATCTVWGKLSDITARRVGLLVPTVGLIINVLSFGVLRDLRALLAANILSGLLGGSYSVWLAQAYAALADATRPEHRIRAFAFMEGASCAGCAIGPLCGGVLVRLLRSPSMLGEYTAALRATFCVAAAAAVLLVVVTCALPLGAGARTNAAAVAPVAAHHAHKDAGSRPLLPPSSETETTADGGHARTLGPTSPITIIRRTLLEGNPVASLYRLMAITGGTPVVLMFFFLELANGVNSVLGLFLSYVLESQAFEQALIASVGSVGTVLSMMLVFPVLVPRRLTERNALHMSNLSRVVMFVLEAAAALPMLHGRAPVLVYVSGPLLTSLFYKWNQPILRGIASQLAGAERQGEALSALATTLALTSALGKRDITPKYSSRKQFISQEYNMVSNIYASA
jgi:MFS family permease